jgi:hypothetical protein
MNYARIRRMQREMGYEYFQMLIFSGAAWKLEGAVGREAMQLLEIGACMLPKKSCRDYYGNYIPSRDELKAGTKGTYQNSVRYYSENFNCK